MHQARQAVLQWLAEEKISYRYRYYLRHTEMPLPNAANPQVEMASKWITAFKLFMEILLLNSSNTLSMHLKISTCSPRN